VLWLNTIFHSSFGVNISNHRLQDGLNTTLPLTRTLGYFSFISDVVINENVIDFVAWADIIGTVAGILVLSSFIPQIMKAYKTKKMFDVSANLMILIASGMFLWVIYGFIRSDPVIIGTNAAGFALNITLLVMKIRYDKIQKSSTVKTK
jgi:MtN3 and saliva related transmembrane protein